MYHLARIHFPAGKKKLSAKVQAKSWFYRTTNLDDETEKAC